MDGGDLTRIQRRHTHATTIHLCRYQQREPHTRGQQVLYGQRMLTIASRLDVMNRLGRAMADPTRSRILMTLLEGPSYPAVLARDLGRV